MTPAKQKLVADIKAWALAHYEDGGGDYIIETYTDEEIAEQFDTVSDAARTCELLDSRRKDVQGYAF